MSSLNFPTLNFYATALLVLIVICSVEVVAVYCAEGPPCYENMYTDCGDVFSHITCNNTGECVDVNEGHPHKPQRWECETPADQDPIVQDDLPELDQESYGYTQPWRVGPAEVTLTGGAGASPSDEGLTDKSTAEDPLPCYKVYRCRCDGDGYPCYAYDDAGSSVANFYDEWGTGDPCPEEEEEYDSQD